MVENLFYTVIYAAIFLISYAGVIAFRRWSRRRGLLDVPNERSSHVAPTPRGGGAVIVAVCLFAYAIYAYAVAGTFAWGYVTGGLLIALISWLDDLYTVAFFWRFLVHSVAAGLVIFSNGYLTEIYIPLFKETLSSELLGTVLTFFWIVWLTNAYNFMDGIDGIAGLQTVAAGFGWLIAGYWLNLPTVEFYGGAIACASLGFLIENWQPAKVFMGDVGSAFLGFTFAAMPLLANSETAANSETRRILPLIAVSLNWFFIFDTVFTLCRRALRREKIWEAHRTHIYQQMVIDGYSHRTVTILYGALSGVVIWLTMLWIVKKDFWEPILLSAIIVQTIGLLIFLPLWRKAQR